MNTPCFIMCNTHKKIMHTTITLESIYSNIWGICITYNAQRWIDHSFIFVSDFQKITSQFTVLQFVCVEIELNLGTILTSLWIESRHICCEKNSIHKFNEQHDSGMLPTVVTNLAISPSSQILTDPKRRDRLISTRRSSDITDACDWICIWGPHTDL